MNLKFWRDDVDGVWWFQNPDDTAGPMGPYDTKSEMLDDKRGIERTCETAAWKQITGGKHEDKSKNS